MIKPNTYFDGAVQSVESVVEGQRVSVGIVDPGTYDFGVAKSKETIQVLRGYLVVNEQTTVVPGERFVIEAGQRINIRATEAAAYYCVYG